MEYFEPEGLSISARTSLLLRLWKIVPDQELSEVIELVASQFDQEAPHVTTFSDKIKPLSLLGHSDFVAFPKRTAVEERVKASVFDAPYRDGGRPSMRDMSDMKDFFDGRSDPSLDQDVKRLEEAANEAIEEIGDELNSCTSTSELSFIRGYLENLAEIAEIDPDNFNEMFEDRENELLAEEGFDDDSDGPLPFSTETRPDDSDEAIQSLFSTLE